MSIFLALALAPGARAADSEQTRLMKGNTIISSETGATGNRRVKAKILIQASPDIVWTSVHEERKHDPDLAYSKVLNQENNRATLEQKFAFLPVIGTAVCVMANEEKPGERIDYWLLKSDRFKAMEGSWVLTPHDGGKATVLELSTYIDMGYPVPRAFMDTITSRKLERRLNNVRVVAEKSQRLAHKS